MKKYLSYTLGLTLITIVVVIGVLYYYNPALFGVENSLTIYHAGSLEFPFSHLEEIFEEQHPDINVLREASGSVVAAKKVTELNKSADIVAVADYNVILSYMFNAHADWEIIFAANEMVIAYTNESIGASNISSNNWYEVLLDPRVRWGHADPNLDPAGYRSLFVLQLAEIYYDIEGLNEDLLGSNRTVRPKSVDLIALLESGELDYAFEYKSVAIQHGLEYIELPVEINLSSPDEKDFYAQASYTLDDNTTITGTPILYGLTIPKNAKHVDWAIEFIKLLLSDTGSQVFEENGQNMVSPALGINKSNMPPVLGTLVVEWNP